MVSDIDSEYVEPAKDRFDLEDEITSLSIYSDQLIRLARHIRQEGITESTQSKVSKALEGIAINLNIHAIDMEDTMCQVLKLYPYNEGITAYEE